MKLNVKGTIVSNDDAWIYEWLEMEHTSPKTINNALDNLEDGEDITVEINSGGGSVFAGSEIYTTLRKLNPKVEIVGLAGSAASFIAMAGETVSISPTAQIMIHNASTIHLGDKHEMNKASDFLGSIDSSIASAYQIKTNLSESDILEMMSKETWLSAKDAVEKGFADEVMFEPKIDAVASVGVTLPPNVIDKIRNLKTPKENKLNSLVEQLVEKVNAMENKLDNISTQKVTNKTKNNMKRKWK